MGYHVSIVRTDSGRNNPITEKELVDFASRSPGFRIEHPPTPKGSCTVLVYSRDGHDICGLLHSEREGVLWTKNPTNEDLELMLQVSKALGGRVRGDEYETFRTATDIYTHPDDEAESEAAEVENARFRRAWQRRNAIWLWIKIIGVLTLTGGLAVTYIRN